MLFVYPAHPFSIVLKRFWKFTVIFICFTKQKTISTNRIITYRSIFFCVETYQFHSSAQETKKYVTFRYVTVDGKPALISHPTQFVGQQNYSIQLTLPFCCVKAFSQNFIESRQKKTFRALKIKYRINQLNANNLVIIAKYSQ